MSKRQMVLSPLVQVKSYIDIDTHTHAHSPRHAVVHVSVLDGHLFLPLFSHLTCCHHSSLSLSSATSTVLNILLCLRVLFNNHSTQTLPMVSDHLWNDPLQPSHPEDWGSDCRILPACVLICFYPDAPSARSPETGTQVT